MSSTTHTAHPQGEAAALHEALRLALAALEKALDDGCAIETHDRMTIDGDTWTFGGICALAHDALTNESNTTTGPHDGQGSDVAGSRLHPRPAIW